MSKRKDVDLLCDMIGSIERILLYMQQVEYDDFVEDCKTQDAVIRNIEILGEASKLISDVIRNEYVDIPWRNIAGTRDRLIHNYFGINIDIVWTIVRTDLPRLLAQLKAIDLAPEQEH
jgi:uncharacterized protein with HEPN domain